MTSPSTVTTAVPTSRWRIPHLRWVLAGILLLVSVINYLDRQALSILATTIQRDLSISDTGYARIVQVFLLAYTVMHLLGGRLVDRFGARLAEAGFITWWSVANMLTSLASGFFSLAFFRMLLGMGEPGHYSASGKMVAEWFPARERGIAVGMYTMGGTLGAALAAPVVAYLALHFGWRSAFLVTGALGLIPALLWYLLYRPPAGHPLLAASERAYLQERGVFARPSGRQTGFGWRELLAQRPLWLVMVTRMITDPLWYFYLFWFPKYLQEVREYSLAEIGMTLWVVYISADAGCLLGGWLSGRLIRHGVEPVTARLRIMTGAAVVLACSFLLPWLGGKVAPLLIASVFTCAEMVWMSSSVTLPIDIFPAAAVGSVQGAIGAGGSLGGFFATGVVAYLISNFSYDATFVVMSLLHPLAIALLLWQIPRSAATLSARSNEST